MFVDKDLQALTLTFRAVACGSQALQVFVSKYLQALLRLCRMRRPTRDFENPCVRIASVTNFPLKACKPLETKVCKSIFYEGLQGACKCLHTYLQGLAGELASACKCGLQEPAACLRSYGRTPSPHVVKRPRSCSSGLPTFGILGTICKACKCL